MSGQCRIGSPQMRPIGAKGEVGPRAFALGARVGVATSGVPMESEHCRQAGCI